MIPFNQAFLRSDLGLLLFPSYGGRWGLGHAELLSSLFSVWTRRCSRHCPVLATCQPAPVPRPSPALGCTGCSAPGSAVWWSRHTTCRLPSWPCSLCPLGAFCPQGPFRHCLPLHSSVLHPWVTCPPHWLPNSTCCIAIANHLSTSHMRAGLMGCLCKHTTWRIIGSCLRSVGCVHQIAVGRRKGGQESLSLGNLV